MVAYTKVGQQACAVLDFREREMNKMANVPDLKELIFLKGEQAHITITETVQKYSGASFILLLQGE